MTDIVKFVCRACHGTIECIRQHEATVTCACGEKYRVLRDAVHGWMAQPTRD